MSDVSGEIYLDHAGLRELSARLTSGAVVLDDTAASAPPAPDAGRSTPLVGDLLAGMSGTVSDLVTSVDVTAVSMRDSTETLDRTDSDGAQQFSAFGE